MSSNQHTCQKQHEKFMHGPLSSKTCFPVTRLFFKDVKSSAPRLLHMNLQSSSRPAAFVHVTECHVHSW